MRFDKFVTVLYSSPSYTPYTSNKLGIILRVREICMLTKNILSIRQSVVLKFKILICLKHKQYKFGFYQKKVCTRKL